MAIDLIEATTRVALLLNSGQARHQLDGLVCSKNSKGLTIFASFALWFFTSVEMTVHNNAHDFIHVAHTLDYVK